MLNKRKAEKARLPPLIGFAPGLMVGGPSNGVADTLGEQRIPVGYIGHAGDQLPSFGGDSNGSEVAGWITQIPARCAVLRRWSRR